MCGIAGWIDWERDVSKEGDVVERMAATLARRGPDDKGLWLSPRAALGHRRLAIIDPANGRQPMTFTDDARSFALVYNGELYNFQKLRDELVSRGHAFHTRCDTEVVLHAYMEWGADCVARFDGIFAFAVWDAKKEELFVARDPLGVKPFFFARRGSAFLFGSELKALLAHPFVSPEVDREGLAELFLSCQGPAAGRPGVTPYRGIEELRPGRWMRVRRDGITERTYWKLESKPHTDDMETTIARARELIVGSVTRQMVSDVPVASLLSGGVDSSGVTAIAQRESRAHNATMQSWCIDFVDGERDFISMVGQATRDAPYAAEAAAYLGTAHHLVELHSEAMVDALLECMRARDLPVSGQHDASLLLLFRALKQEATVALSGEGGDESFGGYVWYWRTFTPDDSLFPWMFDRFDTGCAPDVAERIGLHAHLTNRLEEARAEVPLLAGESPEMNRWRTRIYLNLTRFLGWLLTRKDRLGMWVSVEGRVPFCDAALVQYMWNVPPAMQMVDGVEKTILRKALEGYLPDSVLYRKKAVFPFNQNLAYLEALRRRVREIIAEGKSPALDLFDRKLLEERCTSLFHTPSHTALQLELFTEFDAWLREYRISLI